jgi:imidazole glycerol phosphate synthase subunit HisF
MNFVFMLTHHDTTVPNADKVYEGLRGTALRYVGFKDIGATPDELAVVTEKAHADGLEVFLEVVSTSKESELASLEAALHIGVDWVMGGTHAEEGVRILAGSRVKYCPFPGRIEGHPSILLGSVVEIAQDAKDLTAMDGVFGLDLLAYRHLDEDPIEVTREVVSASSGPVIVAGSIVTAEQIRLVAAAGAWGFTIGGAIFEGRLPGAPDLADQISAVLKMEGAEVIGD